MPAGDMDAEYSIGINNRFLGIESDMIDDPLEIIRAAQEKPKKDKDVKGKTKKEVKPIKGSKEKEKTVKTDESTEQNNDTKRPNTSDRPRGGRGGRGGRGRGGERGGGRGRGRGGFGSGDSPKTESSGGFGDAPREPRPPRGACHGCGEEGHFVRSCPTKNNVEDSSNDYSSGGFGAPSSGGFGAPSGGFGAPSSGGFGAPSSGGFGSGEDDRRGGRGGFRGGRGGRGGRGRGARGGREFDRRSGSDKSSSVKAFEKRDGSGSYNWGTPQDELAATEEQVTAGGFGSPKDVEEPPVETTENVQDSEENVSSGEENKENAAAQQLSYEEWKQQQEQSRSKPQFNIRKANEGEKIKGMKVIKKPTEEENEQDGSLFFPKKYYEEKLKTSGRVKEELKLDFQFAAGDNRHLDIGGGRRGGRGRGRGNRGGRKDESAGGNIFGGGSKKEIQLEDQNEFPTLG